MALVAVAVAFIVRKTNDGILLYQHPALFDYGVFAQEVERPISERLDHYDAVGVQAEFREVGIVSKTGVKGVPCLIVYCLVAAGGDVKEEKG